MLRLKSELFRVSIYKLTNSHKMLISSFLKTKQSHQHRFLSLQNKRMTSPYPYNIHPPHTNPFDVYFVLHEVVELQNHHSLADTLKWEILEQTFRRYPNPYHLNSDGKTPKTCCVISKLVEERLTKYEDWYSEECSKE